MISPLFQSIGDIFSKTQPVDAEHLHFHNEKEFARFLRKNRKARYFVSPAKFRRGENVLDVLPLKRMSNSYDGVIRMVPDPNYYNVGVPDNVHYLHEDLFLGKRYVSLKDHSHVGKFVREMILPIAPDTIDLLDVDETLTHPKTGQKVTFYDVYQWANRDGEHIHNLNLKLWLLWGFEGVVTMPIASVHRRTGVDMTFGSYFPGHTNPQTGEGEITLYFHNMESTYGFLKP